MKARCQTAWLFALAVGATPGMGQTLVYVEPGIASCPALPATIAPRTVQRGAPVVVSLLVTCGFDQGSYTVSLNSSDAAATIAPKTLLINFGRVAGNGSYTVRFSTVGVHTLSAAITSNMGSPAVRGQFVGAVKEFKVVQP